MDASAFGDADGENVVIAAGDVTSIHDAPAAGDDGDAVSTGGTSVAASLSADLTVLNLAFLTGRGDAQIIQLKVADLRRPGGSSGPAVITGHLTTISEAAISAGGGAATDVGEVAVSAGLSDAGELSLSFVDGDGHLQLLETTVAELL